MEILFAKGRKGYAGPLRYFWYVFSGEVSNDAESDEQGDGEVGGSADIVADIDVRLPSVLFSVPKKFLKRANKRNLMKRRTREAYRHNKHTLIESATAKRVNIYVAFVYNTSVIHDYNTVENGVRNALEKIRKSL